MLAILLLFVVASVSVTEVGSVDGNNLRVTRELTATTKKSKAYQQSVIHGLPDSVKDKIVVRVLKKAGSLEFDKVL